MLRQLSSIGVILLFALCLGACGPEGSSSDGTALARTEEIAADYQNTRDLAAAQSALGALDVANVNQWLIYVTESAIDSGDAVETTNALVAMALDLGLQSGMIQDYARANGLRSTFAASAGNSVVASLNAGGTADDTSTQSNAVETGNGETSGVETNSPEADTDSTEGNVAESNVGESDGNGEILVPMPSTDEDNSIANNQVVQLVPTPVEATEAQDDTSEDEPVGATPTADVAQTALAPTPEPTAIDNTPSVFASTGINIRTGPGVQYEIAGALEAGDSAQIAGKNPAADWWEIIMPSGRQGWVYRPLVQTNGDVNGVAIAANIPTPPPPTPTSVPVSPPPATALPVAEEQPEVATPEPAPAPAGPDFRVVEKRLWDVVENGGRLDGPSVTCGEKRQLVIRVLDAGGNLLNGVAVQAIYGAQEIFVTGNQGKGDGTVEFVLGGGQAVKVIRDADGREVSSEEAHNLSTKPWEIPFEILIGGRFCTDDASCQSFVDATGCYGHYSWTVTFQRNY